ncbi:beta-1,3-glucanase family protein [Streptomyces sp. CMB-StM0423]|uniref:beta-1,3-glucanase family protein n=1 Tax=Streptomyces sp. CMB-StM0423 TaxID=2059884 RepID=UPI000C710207|nr:beta-1,3-glucanase family protein [Streptomyces sp. CMB-StM0423]AUH43313.1 glycosyl hydrolase [Streptomyces sp. CMB-StM0423]
MISRRRLLGGLAVASAAAGTPLVLSAARAGGAAAALDVTVVNKTGAYENSSISIYVVGNEGGRQVRLTPDGSLAPIEVGDNGPDGYTDYAIPFAGSGDTGLTLPNMSGRLYVALGGKLKMKAVTDGAGNAALAYPAGWVSTDPNYPVLHDCMEFTLNDAGMFCNTTMVDMFSVPMSIHLTGAKDQTTGTLKDGARQKVFDTLAGTEGFGRLVDGDGLRVIAPGHGLDAGLFDGAYLDGYVDEVWSAYAGKDLKVTTNAGTFTGRVAGDRLSFAGPADVAFDRPPTRDVLFCDGKLAAPNDGTTGPVAAILGAALNRTTLRDHADQPVTDASAFYGTGISNHYARVMHEVSEDGRAYGFAFDDVSGFASYIEDGAPQQLTLTLTPF